MPAERIRGIVEHTNALKPDVIVLLGDFAASHKFKTRSVAPRGLVGGAGRAQGAARRARRPRQPRLVGRPRRPAHAARAPCSAGACWSATASPSTRTTSPRLAKDGRRFWLAGLGDQIAFITGRRKDGRRTLSRASTISTGTLAKVTDDAPVILLAHEPDIFPQVPARVSLTLSGHTHGGQVRVFGYSPMVPSRYGNRYAYGHIVEDDRHLVVSGGLGCSILPVRIGVPPEIVMVDVAAA